MHFSEFVLKNIYNKILSSHTTVIVIIILQKNVKYYKISTNMYDIILSFTMQTTLQILTLKNKI